MPENTIASHTPPFPNKDQVPYSVFKGYPELGAYGSGSTGLSFQESGALRKTSNNRALVIITTKKGTPNLQKQPYAIEEVTPGSGVRGRLRPPLPRARSRELWLAAHPPPWLPPEDAKPQGSKNVNNTYSGPCNI